MKPRYHPAGISLLAALLLALSGCSSARAPETAARADDSSVMVTGRSSGLLSFFKPYRIDIQQGNFVSREMVSQLRPGLTRDQVRFVLGTPLLADIFHTGRWDYDFHLAKGNGEIIASRVTVFFKGDDTLDRVEGGGDLPTESEYLTLISNARTGAGPAVISDTGTPPAPSAVSPAPTQ